jgi:hypothetical protein
VASLVRTDYKVSLVEHSLRTDSVGRVVLGMFYQCAQERKELEKYIYRGKTIMASKWIHKPLSDFQAENGFAYLAYSGKSQLSSHRHPSPAQVLEDGIPLPGPANALHEDIRLIGQGRFSFWYEQVYFSTSDNSDPRTNDRVYEMAYPGSIASALMPAWLSRIRKVLKVALASQSQKENQPVNLGTRDSSPESLQKDVEYAAQVGQNFVGLLPEGPASLMDKTVLEIGPGINFGSTLLMACMGARVMVADPYLAPWDRVYHPKFYALLRGWVKENMPQADLTSLDNIISKDGYPKGSIDCYTTPLEMLEGIADESVDIIFSNAVLEHLVDPLAAFRQLVRVSRSGALGFHQVDFRDHFDFSKPLEYLLIGDKDFETEFLKNHGERGNRYRPKEYAEMFEASGFQVKNFVPSCYADERYLASFMPRLRAATGSRYRNVDIAELNEISGLYCLEIQK